VANLDEPTQELLDELDEALVGGLVDRLAAASRAHRVMISITISPLDDDGDGDDDGEEVERS